MGFLEVIPFQSCLLSLVKSAKLVSWASKVELGFCHVFLFIGSLIICWSVKEVQMESCMVVFSFFRSHSWIKNLVILLLTKKFLLLSFDHYDSEYIKKGMTYGIQKGKAWVHWTRWDLDTCSVLSSFCTRVKISTGLVLLCIGPKPLPIQKGQICRALVKWVSSLLLSSTPKKSILCSEMELSF